MNCEFGTPSRIPHCLMENNPFVDPCIGWTLDHYMHRHCPMTKKYFRELTDRNDMSVSPWRQHCDCLLCDEDMETEMDQYRYWAP